MRSRIRSSEKKSPLTAAVSPACGIDQQLRGPEVEAGEVDLGRRPVTELEIEAPLRDVDRSLA